MAICVFPGTFNPIHNAHLMMAEHALKHFGFEKIIFIPSYLPPHKEINSNLADHRLEMVKIAVKNNQYFEVSDIEYKSEGKSYSLITVKKLIEQYGLTSRLNFIIGTDAFAKINTWYKAEELKELVHFIVFPRNKSEINVEELKKQNWDFELINWECKDISSTEIRNGEKNKIDKNVEDYIKHNELYKS